MRIKQLILCMVTAFFALAMCGVKASAEVTGGFDPGASCSLTLHIENESGETWAADGAEITLYKAAEIGWNGTGAEYTCTEGFSSFTEDIDIYSNEQAAALANIAKTNNVSGTAVKADRQGVIPFTDLTPGLYLVVETDHAENAESFRPFMVPVPFMDNGKWLYDVDADPKLFPAADDSKDEVVDISVLKQWSDDGVNRPSSVTVRLLNSKGVFDTVTLDSSNDWKHTWKQLDSKETWSVQEIDIPAGYTVTYKQNETAFTVINTKNPPPPGEKLVQTGQLKWPVPVLTAVGMALVIIGIVLRRSGKREEMKTKREKAGFVLIALGVFCIGAAMGVFTGQYMDSRRAGKSVQKRLGYVREYIEKVQSGEESVVIPGSGQNADAAVSEDGQPVPMYSVDPETAMPLAVINGDTYIGILSLPSLGLEMPVTSICTLDSLRYTVGRYYGSARTGDLVIAGHNYQSGFGKLRQLSIGQQISFTEMDGTLHTYTVQELEVVDPESIPYMIQGDWALSLYTCTYSGKQRFTVRCSENP